MRIVLPLAAGLALGIASTTTAQAAPAMPQPDAVLGHAATPVDWHPSRSHWDHHYHSHQDSMRYREPSEAERQIERGTRRVRNPEWSEYRPRGGSHVRLD